MYRIYGTDKRFILIFTEKIGMNSLDILYLRFYEQLYFGIVKDMACICESSAAILCVIFIQYVRKRILNIISIDRKS